MSNYLRNIPSKYKCGDDDSCRIYLHYYNNGKSVNKKDDV